MVVPAILVREESGDAGERACFELRSLTGPSTHMWCYHRLSYVEKGPAPVREHTSHRVRHFPRVAHSLLPALLSPFCNPSALITYLPTRFLALPLPTHNNITLFNFFLFLHYNLVHS
jgi:hypothetical protein